MQETSSTEHYMMKSEYFPSQVGDKYSNEINGTDIDPGGLFLHNNVSAEHAIQSLLSTAYPGKETDTDFHMTKTLTTYTLVIILLSVTVLLAIVFVLFGLFMKAGAFTRTAHSASNVDNRGHFIKGQFDIETGETAMFGPEGFGGFGGMDE